MVKYKKILIGLNTDLYTFKDKKSMLEQKKILENANIRTNKRDIY